jgi:hypothetical protein
LTLLWLILVTQLPINNLNYSSACIVVVKLAYASPAWWGFASAADKARIEAFLRRSVHFDYRADSASTFVIICAAADDKLFALIKATRGICFTLFSPFTR